MKLIIKCILFPILFNGIIMGASPDSSRVTTFGAKSDTSNSAPAFKLWANYISVNKIQGIIPYGEYYLKYPVGIDKIYFYSKHIIYGEKDSIGRCPIIHMGHNVRGKDAGFQFHAFSDDQVIGDSTSFKDIVFNGDYDTTKLPYTERGHGQLKLLSLDKSSYNTVDGCSFLNSKASGVLFTRCKYSTLVSSYFESNGDYFWSPDTVGGWTDTQADTLGGNRGFGACFWNCLNPLCMKCKFIKSAQAGVLFRNGDDNNSTEYNNPNSIRQIYDCYFENCGYSAIDIEGANGKTEVFNNVIFNTNEFNNLIGANRSISLSGLLLNNCYELEICNLIGNNIQHDGIIYLSQPIKDTLIDSPFIDYRLSKILCSKIKMPKALIWLQQQSTEKINIKLDNITASDMFLSISTNDSINRSNLFINNSTVFNSTILLQETNGNYLNFLSENSCLGTFYPGFTMGCPNPGLDNAKIKFHNSFYSTANLSDDEVKALYHSYCGTLPQVALCNNKIELVQTQLISSGNEYLSNLNTLNPSDGLLNLILSKKR